MTEHTTRRDSSARGCGASAAPALVEHAPRFSARDAVGLAHELYGVAGSANPLPSERDQNFLIESAEGARYVLKIANATEQREILDFQNRAMQHLAARLADDTVPQPLKNRDGQLISTTTAPAGTQHFVRLLNYLPGVCLAQVKPHTPELLASLGAVVARLDLAFEGFSHPLMLRDFHWDLKHTLRIRGLLPHIEESARRAVVERLLERFEQKVQAALPALRAGVIHNDCNDYNVLVSPRSASQRRVTGVIDFGDMVHSPLVCDLAVAAAYALLSKPDAVAAAAQVVGGYHAVLPLKEAELALLFELICARLCLSVTFSAYQHKQSPANEYLRISEAAAWAALEKLAATPPEWAHYAFRHACGLPPCPRSNQVVEWLRSNQEKFGRVVEPDLRDDKALVLDLSVGSAELPADLEPFDAQALTEIIFGRMRAAGAQVGIGRYTEARLLYRSESFRKEGNNGPEWRTIHLGTDLYLEPGGPVYAPLDGSVHSFRDNALPLDYGPTVILQHIADGFPFFTLYGHLSRSLLNDLREGMPVRRGQQIATIGETNENGGWPPHLHFQIITDLLGKRGDFPGVATPSEREIWLSLCPDPNLILQVPAERFPRTEASREEILRLREQHLSRALSLSYARPLKIVRGFMQYLYDDEGRAYLDAINNVPHVGHCHPRVVRVAQQQMAMLNTNTRYLYAQLAEYVERLCSLFPEPLRVCFLVCSGSEANELALRLARAHTKRKDVLVMDSSYHGNTTSLIEISPYKFNGPGGEGAPPHVHVVPVPDTYRGPWKAADADAGARYARHVAEAIARAEAVGRKVGAYIAEPLFVGAGIVAPPQGYLREAYRYARAAGAVCIADEVQVGFGRLGTHLWGFQTQDVVPDIVTLGKPIGNGHPLAAVVTTPEIAASFATGMEYFNTFGGNPVSCAIGLAVLDVMRDERLQENARVVGERLKAGLRKLQEKYPLIGDVRGTGFLIGVELVLNRDTLEPAAAQAAYIAERMKDRGILISTEGPRHNVLKIRPPMVFTAADADKLLSTLDYILSDDFLRVE